ncbi:TetR/AcrR family transcriptional regulator [Mesorhizobium sp.]|uniref:TetR/AcrR family transcriptional regulator n=1 Tax=Mesorhizobium sp. TaxID=1871066 RepID=UPI0025B908AE|nr:TetR/AcrR family transcriptional regulator [Mesorhizobium sp.]
MHCFVSCQPVAQYRLNEHKILDSVSSIGFAGRIATKRPVMDGLAPHDQKRTPPVPAGSIDRRVARTRSLLQQALYKLTAEKGYAAVTVEDICREANVGRSTFYTHYPDKECLRKARIDEHMKAMRARGDARNSRPNARGFAFSGPAFEHAHATREMHRALMGGKKREMPEEIRGWISGLVRRELASIQGDNESGARLEIATRFIVGAFFEVMHWWLDEDTKLSPAQVDQIFQQLAFDGMNTVLAAPSNA